MSDRAKKKEKHRLKRLAKQRQARKTADLSPLREVINFGGKLECWINSNWREQGMVNLLVLGTAKSGRNGLSAFLIDNWCVGLKDAWGRTQLMRLDFTDLLKKARQGMPMRECSLEEARQLVAGAVRFSRQNGFTLPKDWQKWVEMLGELDFAFADLSDFGKDGGLLYVGDMPFLRKRLKGSTPEEFFARPDVHYVMQVAEEMIDGYDDDEDDFDDEEENSEDESSDFPGLDTLMPPDTRERMGEKLRAIADEAKGKLRRQFELSGESIPPHLDEAADCLLLMAMTRQYAIENGLEDTEVDNWHAIAWEFLARTNAKDAEEIFEICELIAPAFGFPTESSVSPPEPILPSVLPPGV